MSDLPEPESFIQHSEKLTRIFGYWPSFHDAEVIDVHLWRGDIDPDRERYTFPVFTIKLHVWELTCEADERGFLVTRHHTLATLRFHDVTDGMTLTGFNYQNEIFALNVVQRRRESGSSPYVAVEFQPGLGMAAAFECQRVEVLEALRCDEHGQPSDLPGGGD